MDREDSKKGIVDRRTFLKYSGLGLAAVVSFESSKLHLSVPAEKNQYSNAHKNYGPIKDDSPYGSTFLPA